MFTEEEAAPPSDHPRETSFHERALIPRKGRLALSEKQPMNEQETLRIFAWVFGGLVLSVFMLTAAGMQ